MGYLTFEEQPDLAFEDNMSIDEMNARDAADGSYKPGIWTAQFETENVIGSALAKYEDYPEIITKEDEEALAGDWTSAKGLEGSIYDTPEFHERFKSANTPSELTWQINNFEREEMNRQVISETGLAENLGTTFAVALIDPFQLALMAIPVVKGTMMARTGYGAMAGAFDMAITEAGLSATQGQRTLDESFANIGAGAIFGGVLGGAFGRRLLSDSEVDNLNKGFSEDAGSGKMFSDSDGTFFDHETSAGAMETRFLDPKVSEKRQLELYEQMDAGKITQDERITLVAMEANENLTFVGEKFMKPIRRINPSIFLGTSPFPMAKRIGEFMMESGVIQKGNRNGVPRMDALDTKAEVIKIQRVLEINDVIASGYAMARKAGYKKSINQYKKELSSVYEKGAVSGVKHFDDTAKAAKSSWETYEQRLTKAEVLTSEDRILYDEWELSVANAEKDIAKLEKKLTMTGDERRMLDVDIEDYKLRIAEAEDALKTAAKENSPEAKNITSSLKALRKKFTTAKSLQKKTATAKRLDRMNEDITAKKAIRDTEPPAGSKSPITPKGSVWYMPRIMIGSIIMKYRQKFIKATSDDITEQLREAVAEATSKTELNKATKELEYALSKEGRDALEKDMDKVVDRITGMEVTEHSIATGGHTSNFKVKRRFQVRTSALTDIDVGGRKPIDFIETDMMAITKAHAYSMTPELVAKESGFDLPKMLMKLEEEAKFAMKNAKSERQRRRFNDEWVRAKKVIVNQELIRTNQFRNLDDTFTAMNTAKDTALMYNVMRSLGAMAVSALTDLSRIVARTGLRRMSNTFRKVVTMPKDVNMARGDALIQLARIDLIQANRVNKLMLTDDMGPGMGGGSRVMANMTNNFVKYTGMNHMNATEKQFVALAYSDDIFKVALGKRKLTKRDIRDFATAGLSVDDFKKISVQYRKHGVDFEGDATVHIGHTDKWVDEYGEPLPIQRKLLNVLQKEIDVTIVTPGSGDLPHWMRKSTGQIVGQFKSFGFASVNKTFIPETQKMFMGDPNAYAGFMTAMMLGGMVYGLKSWGYGKEMNTEWNHMVREMIDRSGYFGVFTDIHAMVEKLTAGKVGLQAILGGQTLSRYYTRSVVGDMLGPSFGLATDTSRAMSALFSGEMTDSDIRSIRRLFPYQNLVWIRKFINEIEDKASEALVQ